VIKRLIGSFAAGTVMILTLGAVQVASAQGSNGPVVVNDHYVLRADETLNGDVTIVARQVELEAGSQVNGVLSIIAAGSVVMDGEVHGDLSILASSTHLGKTFHLYGDLSVCSREYVLDPAATISGSQNTGCNQLGSVLSGVARSSDGSPKISIPFFGGSNENLLTRLFRVLLTACALAALAALAVAVFPRQINRLTGTAMTSAATTTIFGFLSMCVALAITVLYLLSLVLTVGLTCLVSPLFGLMWLIILAGLLVGWIAVSVPVGKMILHRLHMVPTPMVAAAVGTLTLTFVQGFLSFIPCINILSWLLLIVLGSTGFGSALLTRFGTRPYPEIVTAHPPHNPL
jgi:hypothetical protein